MAAIVFAENLFGAQLNAFFLRFPGIDKLLHATEYAVVFVYVHWLLQSGTTDPRKRVILAASAGVALSLLDEFVQQFAPDRSVEAFDILADWSGLTFGAILTLRPRPKVAVALATLAISTLAYVAYDTHQRLYDFSLALRYEHNHEFGRAREHYLKAVARGVHGADIYNGLAWVSVESGEGDPGEAVRYAKLALDMQPHNPDVLDTYGWALHFAGRHQEALPPLLQAFKMQPDIYCIHYHLGAVYLSLDQPASAREHFCQQLTRRGTREAGMAAAALSRMGATQACSAAQADAR